MCPEAEREEMDSSEVRVTLFVGVVVPPSQRGVTLMSNTPPTRGWTRTLLPWLISSWCGGAAVTPRLLRADVSAARQIGHFPLVSQEEQSKRVLAR